MGRRGGVRVHMREGVASGRVLEGEGWRKGGPERGVN